MKRAILILFLAISPCVLSGCPAHTNAVNRGNAMPAPPQMGAPCDPMGIKDVPTKESGFSRLEPGAECAATRRCDAKGGCTMEVTSRAVTKGTALAFVLDGQGGVSGPSAEGASQAPQIVSITLGKSQAFFVGSEDVNKEMFSLTGRHWKRIYNYRGVGNEPPYSLSAVIEMPYGSALGAFGFRLFDAPTMPPSP